MHPELDKELIGGANSLEDLCNYAVFSVLRVYGVLVMNKVARILVFWVSFKPISLEIFYGDRSYRICELEMFFCSFNYLVNA